MVELLEAARWLHQRDANRPGPLWPTLLVLALATLFTALAGAVMGSFLGLTLPGTVAGALLPAVLTLSKAVGRYQAYRQAVQALHSTDPEAINIVQEYNRELFEQGLKLEVRTPRHIKHYRLLLKPDVALVGVDYAEWLPLTDLDLEEPHNGASRLRIREDWIQVYIRPEDYLRFQHDRANIPI